MNEMTLVGQSVKLMTSKEVAELVEKRHDNVKRTIETLAASGVIGFPQSKVNPTSESGGRPGTVYLLDKRSSLIVVAQLSPEFTARVVDRWQEFEAQAATGQFKIPSTLPEALRLAADLSEQNEAMQRQIALDRPKTIFADSVSSSSTTILIGELAKLLKQNGIDMGQNRLFDWLRENGYLIKRESTDRNMPTQKSMESGLFEIKERTIVDPEGNVRIAKTPRVTGKGQQYFITKFIDIREAANA